MPASAAASTRDPAPAAFWDGLAEELALWRAAGLTATFWWRDDDAAAAHPALTRLARLSADASAPVGVAAVPRQVAASLAPALRDHPTVELLQHGYAHANHARGLGLGAWELGLQRPMETVLAELAAGRAILAGAFGPQFIPVAAAPWNRIDRRLLPGLAGLGFVGVSASGERTVRQPVPGLVEANIHFDLLAWKAGGRFRGEASALAEIVGHLRRRRLGEADRGEPTGILSHHLDLDEPAWRFLADLLAFVARHPAARWLSPREIFGA
jgi:hypothetical protein